MPAERGSFLLGNLARELIGRVQGCSDNEHFFGGGSVLSPTLRAVNSTMTDRREDSMHAHSADA